MKLSVVIMADPRRERFVEGLLGQLPGAQVVWDQERSRTETGRRAMLAHPKDADWGLTVQDDAILCRDFLAGVKAALAHVPDCPASFYTGQARPYGQAVKAAVERAVAARRPFLTMPGPLWGVAVAVPVGLIDPMIAEYDTLRGIGNFDMRMATHFTRQRVECWHTIPSLANHRVGEENPSLVPGRSASSSRVAHAWIEDGSPLDIDWSRGCLRADEFHQTKRRARMARIAPTVVYGIDASGVRRRVPAGQRIPGGLRLEQPLDAPSRQTPEDKRIAKNRSRRQGALDPDQLAKLPMGELRDLAKNRGIKVPFGTTKADLAVLLAA